jgi:tRNA nucleotidyltransferase (CCA-adding enzyme)
LAEVLGHAPGPWLSELLEALREEQVVGAVRSRAQALAFARRWESARSSGEA